MALETIYIRADGSVEPTYAPIQRSGDVYTLTGDINSDIDGIVIEKNDTILNGAGHRLQGMNVQFSRGLYLLGDSNVTIRNITITSFENGILLDAYSFANLIVDNRLEGNDYAVSCWAFSDNNTIVGNNMTANNLAAIWIAGSSNVTVTNNHIMNNNQYGIIMESSYNDTICRNNFIDNTNQVDIYDSTGTWDNGWDGNYWSDYQGTDSNGDGIGDTIYTIDLNNSDRFPLMNPFWILVDVNHDLRVDMRDIGRITAAFGSYPGHPKWNPHADVTGRNLAPDGIVDMRDVGVGCANFGKKYPS